MTVQQVNYAKHNDYDLCVEKQMKNYKLQIKIFLLSDQLRVYEACSLTDAAPSGKTFHQSIQKRWQIMIDSLGFV